MKTTPIVIGCITAVALILSGCGKDSASQPSAASQPAAVTPVAVASASSPAPEVAVPVPPPPSPPSHEYAMVDNGTYGYEPALSEEDVRNGTATKPLIMMRYAGNKGGTYVIIILGQDANDASVTTRMSCQAPCEFAKSELMSGDSVIKTETLRVTPDSIMGGMLADAISGQLVPYGQAVSNQTMPSPAASAPTLVAVQAPASDIATAAPQQAQDSNSPLQQTSFDCNQAGSIAQYLICHDPDLASSDRSLADLVQKAHAAVQDQTAFSDRMRKQWNYREKNCKDKACLTSWYGYETDIMTKIAQTGDVSAQ
jgi:hypothetical protein